MLSSGIGLILFALLWAIGLMVLYWIIRLAVRHAIEDVESRRSTAR